MSDENKTGIERLREFNYLPKDGCPPSEFRRIAKIECIGTECSDCVNLCNEYITGIADQIEREHTDALNEKIETICGLTREIDQLHEHLMPPLLSWPQWDDGKPITEDDAPKDVMAVSIGLDGSCYALHYDIPDYDQMMFAESSKYVERQKHDVLGADGLPIKVGDVVFGEDGTAWAVKGLTDGSYPILADKVLDASKRELRPEWLTHKHPDSQKLIDDDSTLPPGIYCENHGIEVKSIGGFDLASFIVPMITDLLRRQRELDSKMGGE